MRPVGAVRPRLTVTRPPALVRRARVPGIPVLCPPGVEKRHTVLSAECEEPDVFSETSLGEELGSLCQPGMSRVGKTARKTVALEDVEALHQHIQDLKAQLLNANKVIQSLQRRARSISVTSGYTSGAERPLPAPKVLASPAHSLTDEDEGWQSDGHGTLCPPALRAHRDLQSLVHRVALLEAQLPLAKHGATLPKELHSATWPGYGPGGWEQMERYRGFQELPEAGGSLLHGFSAGRFLGCLCGGAESQQRVMHRLPAQHFIPAVFSVWLPCEHPACPSLLGNTTL